MSDIWPIVENVNLECGCFISGLAWLGLEFSISLKETLQDCIIPSQGFLAKDLQAEALCKLDRRVKATIEQFMKILEEIDTLVSEYSAEN